MAMKLAEGLSKTARIEVDDSRTISFMGDEGRVYATPELIRDIEITCRNLLLECIDDGQDSVGTHVDISHIAATPIGMWADITATVKAVDGRSVSFEISANDPVEVICRGSHRRFIVDVDKTLARVKEKASSIQAA